MKIIYQDLIKFFNNPPSKTLLSEKLFQLGHEHEIDGDIIDQDFINEVIKKTELKINRKIIIIDQIDPFDDKLLIYESK